MSEPISQTLWLPVPDQSDRYVRVSFLTEVIDPSDGAVRQVVPTSFEEVSTVASAFSTLRNFRLTFKRPFS